MGFEATFILIFCLSRVSRLSTINLHSFCNGVGRRNSPFSLNISKISLEQTSIFCLWVMSLFVMYLTSTCSMSPHKICISFILLQKSTGSKTLKLSRELKLLKQLSVLPLNVSNPSHDLSHNSHTSECLHLHTRNQELVRKA